MDDQKTAFTVNKNDSTSMTGVTEMRRRSKPVQESTQLDRVKKTLVINEENLKTLDANSTLLDELARKGKSSLNA